MITSDFVNIISSKIVSKFAVNEIFLFGSYSEGRENSESDLDICITADLRNKRKIEMTRAIRKELMNEINIPVDILIYDTEEFKERAALRNTPEYKIRNNGILLNGKN